MGRITKIHFPGNIFVITTTSATHSATFQMIIWNFFAMGKIAWARSLCLSCNHYQSKNGELWQPSAHQLDGIYSVTLYLSWLKNLLVPIISTYFWIKSVKNFEMMESCLQGKCWLFKAIKGYIIINWISKQSIAIKSAVYPMKITTVWL